MTTMQDQEQVDDQPQDAGRPEIVKTERKIPFLGLTRFNEVDIPEVFGHHDAVRWWAEDRNYVTDEGWVGDGLDLPDELEGLNTVIRTLPKAMAVEAAWIHPQTGEVIRTGKHDAVINPTVANAMTRHPDTSDDGFHFGDRYLGTVEEAKEALGDEWHQGVFGDDALYNIPTDDYTVVNPMEFLEELVEVINDRELGDAVFGEFRTFRGGGKVSGDILFNGEEVNVPDRDEGKKPIVTGFQVDWDHFGGTSIQAQGMAMNFECINAFRSFTDKISIKHTGDMDSRKFMVGDKECSTWYEVWDTLFDIIDEKRDQLAEMIRAAMDMRLDEIIDLPDDFADDFIDESHNTDEVNDTLYALYRWAGLPGYLAKEAALDAAAHADDPFNPDWWVLHSGATYAISHKSQADTHAGSQVGEHMRIANDMLFNPPMVGERVEEAYLSAEDETLADEAGGRATIYRDESVGKRREQFEERQQMMAALVAPEQD